MRPVKIEVIINASSGPGHEAGVKDRLAEAFKSAGAEARISLAQSGPELLTLAERAASSDAEIIVAGGGDGTINSVASAVIGSNKVMGLLPFGTMNHFAKDLGIPLEVEGAVKTIVRS